METVLGFIFFTIGGIFCTWLAWVIGSKDTAKKYPAEGVILSYMDDSGGISSYNVLCMINGEEVRAQSDSYFGYVNVGDHVKIQWYYKKHAKDIHDIMVEIQDERLKSVSEDTRKYTWVVVIIAIAFYVVAIAYLIKIIN